MRIFKENPCQHPVIIFKNVKFQDLNAIINFMYHGEVNIFQEQLESFLITAELLQVKGLTDNTEEESSANQVIDNISLDLSSKTKHVDDVITLPTDEPINLATMQTVRDEYIPQESLYKAYPEDETEEVVDVPVVEPIVQEDVESDLSPVEKTQVNSSGSTEDMQIDNQSTSAEDLSERSNSNSDADMVLKFRCNVCPKGFKHPTSLTLHKDSHAGKTQCPVCHRSFSRSYDMRSHLQRIHQGKQLTIKEIRGVESSEDIRYMKLLRLTLRSLAAWPYKEVGEPEPQLLKYHKTYLMIQSLTCLASQVMFIKDKTGKLGLVQMGHLYITCFMNIVALSRHFLPVFQGYSDIFKVFVHDLHLFYHKGKSEYAHKVHLQVHKLSNFYTIYLVAMMMGGIFLFNVTPLLNNVISGAFSSERPTNVTYELSVYYSLPIPYETEFNSYLGVTVYNWYISYFCSSAICIFDLYLSLMVFHLWGNLKILNHNLETFPRPEGLEGSERGAQLFSEIEKKQVFRLLVEQINYHRFIMDFATRMSKFFGPMLCIYYMFHQVSGCLLLLECSQKDPQALVRYGPLTIILFQQLIQLSIVFELIGTMSEKLFDSVYSVPWECMDTSSRRVVLVLLNKVQTPIHVKAMGVADVGVRTMASIIKTSFSYFAFLRTISE